MNSLFLAGLTLFFAQGLAGREKLPPRMIAAAAVAVSGGAFLCSLGAW